MEPCGWTCRYLDLSGNFLQGGLPSSMSSLASVLLYVDLTCAVAPERPWSRHSTYCHFMGHYRLMVVVV